MSKAKRYSEEYKLSAVRKVLKSSENVSTIAKQLGVSHVTLTNWVKKYSRQLNDEGSRLTEDEWAELKRLRKENAQLKRQQEILAKATAFFANQKV